MYSNIDFPYGKLLFFFLPSFVVTIDLSLNPLASTYNLDG